MIEYKYNEKENKFTENGHTMFEADVLARLQRLADLEEQIKQGLLLPKHIVSKCECKQRRVAPRYVEENYCTNCYETV